MIENPGMKMSLGFDAASSGSVETELVAVQA
jgi:hypothetical protein